MGIRLLIAPTAFFANLIKILPHVISLLSGCCPTNFLR